ncbi:MAG: hypothetical protein JRC60_05555 [Deltaproteobacteria bacterium]|nr:hypothetical protein [Deltaproteobacteria bacterium]
MKSFKKVITFTALLSILLFFCDAGVSHFDTGIFDWSVRSIACAAPEGNIPAGDYGVNKGVRNDQSDDSGIKKAGFITLLRILSVVAMCILLAWYIRKRMRL